MATTARLPEGLKLEAEAYAKGLGVSLNALLAVALRDYLDARRGLGARPAEPAAAAVSAEALAPAVPHGLAALVRPGAVRVSREDAQAVPAQAPDWSVQPAQGRRVPCPCGSAKPWKDCHGRKAKPVTIARAMS